MMKHKCLMISSTDLYFCTIFMTIKGEMENHVPMGLDPIQSSSLLYDCHLYSHLYLLHILTLNHKIML